MLKKRHHIPPKKSPGFMGTRTCGEIGMSYDNCAFAEGALQHLDIVKVDIVKVDIKSLHKLGKSFYSFIYSSSNSFVAFDVVVGNG